LPWRAQFFISAAGTEEEDFMDLGIKGKWAIVCASSRGLGRGCAMALAREGVNVVVNGTNAGNVEKTAGEIRETTGVTVVPVVADVATPEGRQKLLDACPQPDILVNPAISAILPTSSGSPRLRPTCWRRSSSSRQPSTA
jgi:NAD(P)-dependent dehydrogenase (short-subunit alcohol dehydrogenase family)